MEKIITSFEGLEKETLKWIVELEKRTANLVADKLIENEIKNVMAYIKDSKYFLQKKDFVRAFEAIIYAYGIYETCLRLDFVKEGKK